MLAFPSKVRFFLNSRPTDMHNGFDGLADLVVNNTPSTVKDRSFTM
jgi:hypothetical protein